MVTLTIAVIPLTIAYFLSVPVGIFLTAVAVAILLLPVEGFEQKECVRTIRLIPRQNATKGQKYVELIAYENTAYFAYDNRKEYDLNGLAYEEGCVKGNIKIYKSSECKSPVLKVFITEPKRGDWTFAPFSTKKEYIFYIPDDTENEIQEFKVTSM